MGKRGPSKTPTKILKMRASKHVPKNEAEEPEPAPGIPDPPLPLDGEALIMWNRMAVQLDDIGILTQVDGNALHRYCETWASWVEATEKVKSLGLVYGTTGDKGQKTVKSNPIVGMAQKYSDQLLRLEQEFGLTPSARSGMSVPNPVGKSKKSRFFEKLG